MFDTQVYRITIFNGFGGEIASECFLEMPTVEEIIETLEADITLQEQNLAAETDQEDCERVSDLISELGNAVELVRLVKKLTPPLESDTALVNVSAAGTYVGHLSVEKFSARSRHPSNKRLQELCA